MKSLNLLQIIGHTPLIKLDKTLKNKKVNLFVKLEGQNPGGSVKDQATLFMVQQAEKKKRTSPGK